MFADHLLYYIGLLKIIMIWFQENDRKNVLRNKIRVIFELLSIILSFQILINRLDLWLLITYLMIVGFFFLIKWYTMF